MTSELEAEIKVYNNLIKQNDLSFLKLSTLFKTITTNGFKFIERSKKALDDYLIELQKENPSATHIICLTNFYNGLKKHFDKMNDMFTNIESQCVNKITEFSNNIKNKYMESISNLIKIDTKLKEEKIKVEKTKNDYFNANKTVVELESKIIQLKESKNKKEEEYKRNNEMLRQSQIYLDNVKAIYFAEINKYNKYATNYEKDYSTEIEKIHKEQEKKITFLYDNLNIIKNELKEFTNSNLEIVNLIEKMNKSMNISRDVNLFKDECNFFGEDKQRFTLEEFLDYDVFKTNSEGKKASNFHKKDKDKKNSNFKMWGFGRKEDKDEQKVNTLIQKIFNDVDQITEDDTSFLMSFVDKKNNHFKFIDLLMENYKSKEFIKVKSLYNFNLLSSLIQLIIDRNSNCIESLLERFYFIIELSENTIYSDKDYICIKDYLCQKIYRLPLFAKKEFWIMLINAKIKIYTEEKTKAEIEKKEKSKNSKGNSTDKGNGTYYSKFKGMFTFNNNNIENKKVENEIVFGQKYKSNLPLYCTEIIEEYIQHFSNFNLTKNISLMIVEDMYKEYHFNKLYYEYFIYEIVSNCTTSKMQIELFQNKTIKTNFYNYKYNMINKDDKDKKDNDDNLYNKYNIESSRKHNYKLLSLSYSVYFLDLEDYKNMMLLNSEYYNILKKVIYKLILLKYPYINIGKKISIWKIMLNFSENKKKYNYNEIRKIILEKSSNEKGRDVIDLDVVRTAFDENKETNQKKLSNILKSIVEVVPGLHYNQGMNYIAAFFLNITNDEDISFYLFLGLLTYSKYGELFKNDLTLLKKFFYIFERLISIFLPELYTFFKDNNIKTSYFISSWFITLFTNSFQSNKTKNNPQILLKIFDLFFYDGWRIIIITSIALLKVYENKIINFPSEELLHFLIGDIIKEDFFDNENFDKFMYILFNFKIEDELLKNLEKEFETKKKMPKLGKDLNFQII